MNWQEDYAEEEEKSKNVQKMPDFAFESCGGLALNYVEGKTELPVH